MSNSNLDVANKIMPEDKRCPIIAPKSSNINAFMYSHGRNSSTEIAPVLIREDNVFGDLI